MSGSRNEWFYKIMASPRTVFTPCSIRLMLGSEAPKNLGVLLNRLVKKGTLVNPMRGIYAKVDYNKEELACKIYTPAYISLEYVLQRSGIIFQYYDAITCVSYLSREIVTEQADISYRKIKGEIMIDQHGIINNGIYSVASPERALLDTMYLNSNYAFDNLHPIDKKKLFDLLPIYGNQSLTQRVHKLFETQAL